MATTCLDEITCENAWGCNITVLDSHGNPVDPLMVETGDSVIFVLGDKPGYSFVGWTLEDDGSYFVPYEYLGDNKYLIHNIDCSKTYLAKFCVNNYRVILSGPSGCFRNREINAQYGSIVTVEATDSPNCRFLYWTLNGDIYSEAKSFEHVVTENIEFVANYDEIEYLIVAKPNKRGRGTCSGGGFYILQETVTLSATPRAGYYFESWEDGITDNPRTVTVRGNKTYIADFQTEENNIMVLPAEGGNVRGAGKYNTGSVVSLQPIPNAGWVFSHWIVDGVDYDAQTLKFVASSNKNIIPVFEKASYTVRFSTVPYGVATFTPSVGGTYEYGTTFTVEVSPNSGYVFAGWKDGFNSQRREITVVCDAEYVAVFEKKVISRRTRVQLNGAVSCALYVAYQDIAQQYGVFSDAYAPSGTVLTLSPVVPDGKRLVSITNSNNETVWEPSGMDSRDALAIPYTVGDENEELTLNFENLSFMVTVSASPLDNDTSGNITIYATVGGSYSFFRPTSYNPKAYYEGVAYGTTLELSVPVTVGDYTFSYWRTEFGSFSTTTINLSVTQALNCVAVFKK